MGEGIKKPKVFLSYSWSSPEHQNWVKELATHLRESAIDAILDIWRLKEGDDKFKFMEQSVTDTTIDKVIIISDKKYAEKADKREGGVGTETQILSPELYEKASEIGTENRIAVVLREKDEKGDPFLPTYVKSRIFIDFSDDSLYSESLEQLTRWIYGKPKEVEPKIGRPPSYILADSKIDMGTSGKQKMAMNALIKGAENAKGLCIDYFEAFAENLERFRIKEPEKGILDEKVYESIEDFLPYRDEFIDFIVKIAKFNANEEIYDEIHRFLENIINYTFWPWEQKNFTEGSLDSFRIIINELFIYVIAILIKFEKFQQADRILNKQFYVNFKSLRINQGLYPFTIFDFSIYAPQARNHRLNQNRINPRGDLIVNRVSRKDITLQDIRQAELVLFIRSLLNSDINNWTPYSLYFETIDLENSKLEHFERSQSATHFNNFKIVLSIDNKEELKNLIIDFEKGKLGQINWNYGFLELKYFIKLDKLCTIK
jgi:hypothetical protein